MTLHWSKPNRDFGFVDALGLAGVVGLLVARYVPVARLPFWGCALRSLTGWPCPGCGLTRVAERVSHLNLVGAWEANPMGTVAALILMLFSVYSLLHLLFKLPVPKVTMSDKEAWAIRASLGLLLVLNYGYVILRTRFPQVLG